MQDFESKEYRVYHNRNINQEINSNIDFNNIQLAEIELDDDLILAVHRS